MARLSLTVVAALARAAYGGCFSMVTALTADLFGPKYFAGNYGAVDLAPAVGSLLLATWAAGSLRRAHGPRPRELLRARALLRGVRGLRGRLRVGGGADGAGALAEVRTGSAGLTVAVRFLAQQNIVFVAILRFLAVLRPTRPLVSPGPLMVALLPSPARRLRTPLPRAKGKDPRARPGHACCRTHAGGAHKSRGALATVS